MTNLIVPQNFKGFNVANTKPTQLPQENMPAKIKYQYNLDADKLSFTSGNCFHGLGLTGKLERNVLSKMDDETFAFYIAGRLSKIREAIFPCDTKLFEFEPDNIISTLIDRRNLPNIKDRQLFYDSHVETEILNNKQIGERNSGEGSFQNHYKSILKDGWEKDCLDDWCKDLKLFLRLTEEDYQKSRNDSDAEFSKIIKAQELPDTFNFDTKKWL